MARKRVKFELIKTTCKRCGCTIYTGNRSLFGMNEAKRKFERICSDCITSEERQEMLSYRPII